MRLCRVTSIADLPGEAAALAHKVGQRVVPVSCLPLREEHRVGESHPGTARHTLHQAGTEQSAPEFYSKIFELIET